MLHRDLVAFVGACLVVCNSGCGGVARGALELSADAAADAARKPVDASSLTDADASIVDVPVASNVLDAADEDVFAAVDLGGDVPILDRGTIDATTQEAGMIDVVPLDTGGTETSLIDALATDTGPVDAAVTNLGPVDAGPADSGPGDAGTTEPMITCTAVTGSRTCRAVGGRAPCCIHISVSVSCGCQVAGFGCLPCS
jgi:hypothetical protein